MYSFSGMYELWGLFIMNFTDRYRRYRCRHIKLVPFHLLPSQSYSIFGIESYEEAGLPIVFLKVLSSSFVIIWAGHCYWCYKLDRIS